MPITEVIEQEDEVIEGEALEAEELESEESEELESETADDDAVIEDEPAEVLVSIEGEEPKQEDDAKAPQWVKDLRVSQKALQRENRELKKRLELSIPNDKPAIEPAGKKPSLEEHDYDTTKYESALDAWYKRKEAADRAENEIQESKRSQEQAWQKQLDKYAATKRELKAPNFDEAEAAVFTHLSVTQQGIIVQGADNPAAIVYALDTHPTKLAELAALKDPVQFAVAIGKLETKLKMSPRNAPPAPERRVVSSGSGKQGALDNTIEKLRAEAEKSGDYSKIHKYKMELKKKQG